MLKGIFVRLRCYCIVALYYIAYLLPRFRSKWIFCEGANSKYLYFDLQERDIPYRTYLVLRNKETVRKLRNTYKNVFYINSLSGIYHLLTSSVYFCTIDLNEFYFAAAGGATIVNLWHGVGIKRMGAINSFENEDLAFKISKFKRFFSLPYLIIRPHYLLSTSPLMNEHFSKCFEISINRCVEAMYPRCKFIQQPLNEILSFLAKTSEFSSLELISQMQKYKKCILYMPTWRDNGCDILESVSFDFSRLNAVLIEKNYLFILKLHPNTLVDVDVLSTFSNIMCLDRKLDLYPILPFTSMLITDYSSIYYDYLLIPNKEILLFPYDEESYLKECREFAFDYHEYTPGKRIYSFEELISILEDEVKCFVDERDKIIEAFWGKQHDLYPQLVSKLV